MFLNISPKDAFLRKGGMDKDDRLEQSGMEFHEKVYKGYLEIAKKDPSRVICIDCSGTKWETHDKIINELKKREVF